MLKRRSTVVVSALPPTSSSGAPIAVEALSARLKADYGILMRPYDVSEQLVRVLTHYWIKPEHIDRTLTAMRTLLDPVSAGRERISAD
ncbi:MAG: hypothetical protein IH587_07380 [Anaerolineae bacterium]|nr:hypothetical protein [Anaerolineae bacterium]